MRFVCVSVCVYDPTEKEILKLPESPEETSYYCVLLALLCVQQPFLFSVWYLTYFFSSLRCPQTTVFKQLLWQLCSCMTGVAWQVMPSPGDSAVPVSHKPPTLCHHGQSRLIGPYHPGDVSIGGPLVGVPNEALL